MATWVGEKLGCTANKGVRIPIPWPVTTLSDVPKDDAEGDAKNGDPSIRQTRRNRTLTMSWGAPEGVGRPLMSKLNSMR